MRWALLPLCLVLNGARLHGQTPEEPAPEPAATRGKTQVLPAGGIRYGAPLGASIYGGVTLGRENPAGYAGPSLVGEVGKDGMRISAGMSTLSLAGTHRAQLSMIRTWNDHGDVRADQTYVGPEVALGVILGVTIGHYWRISDGPGRARFFAIGTVIGV